MVVPAYKAHGELGAISQLDCGCGCGCGCGLGTITLGLAVRLRPGRVVGVEVAELGVEWARTRLRRLPTLKNLSFQNADIYALPFEDESFDRVFGHALLEHLAESPWRFARSIGS